MLAHGWGSGCNREGVRAGGFSPAWARSLAAPPNLETNFRVRGQRGRPDSGACGGRQRGSPDPRSLGSPCPGSSASECSPLDQAGAREPPALRAPTRAEEGLRAPGPRQRSSSAPCEPPPPPRPLLAHPALTSGTVRRATTFPRCSHPRLARPDAQTRACRCASCRPRNGQTGASRGRGHQGRGGARRGGWSGHLGAQ
ncbi:hypothetical protein P7K49_003960 [Saguinus oedipus]|uniref:Uncharacterized protein n=1 Tax=Saguinus oedipus TaxID=9490 RepID=A0ABQ9W626_SAGOE|nr:hypothetical protein P7K49_003960 [Saguinus oedipus]